MTRQPAHQATEQLIGKKIAVYSGEDDKNTGIVDSISFDSPYPQESVKGNVIREDGLRVGIALKDKGYIYEATEFEVLDGS